MAAGRGVTGTNLCANVNKPRWRKRAPIIRMTSCGIRSISSCSSGNGINCALYANEQDIKIIGDIPIFIAYDSADAWANPELFFLDEKSLPMVVAGVPPDYFSETGQLWGNPLYRWDVHKKAGYAWWLERFRSVLNFVDVVRLDHFRGFAGYYEIPYGAPTAETGQWKTGPGKDFFSDRFPRIRAGRRMARCRSLPRTWASSRQMSSSCGMDFTCPA